MNEAGPPRRSCAVRSPGTLNVPGTDKAFSRQLLFLLCSCSQLSSLWVSFSCDPKDLD